jgi:site-specific DNA-cytosine methylase
LRYDAETETLIPLAFNWQAGGDTWTTPTPNRTDTLHAGQVPAVYSSSDLGIQADGSGVVGVGFQQSLGSEPEQSEFVVSEGDGVFHDGESTLSTRNVKAFAQNQRDEIRELDQASSLNAERWGTAKNETLLASLQHVGADERRQNGSGIATADEATYTLDGTSRHGVATTSIVRRLTPLECERLQGFPDGWTDIPGNSDTQRYRQLGNAVAVPVVEWIMRRLVAI